MNPGYLCKVKQLSIVPPEFIWIDYSFQLFFSKDPKNPTFLNPPKSSPAHNQNQLAPLPGVDELDHRLGSSLINFLRISSFFS
jgi:hypothetical protein